jgi:hypothetical protein
MTSNDLPTDEAHFDQIEAAFELAPEHKLLLSMARQAWRRWDEIRRRLDEEGLVVPGRFVDRANPLIALEVTTRNACLRALNALHLPEN